MSKNGSIEVTGRNGLRGVWCRPEGEGAPTAEEWADIRLEDGRRLSLPGRLLERLEDGTFAIPLGPEDLPPQGGSIQSTANLETLERIIPVLAEQVEVGKRRVQTGRVRIHKSVETQDHVVDMPLLRDELEIERVPMDQIVDGPVTIREEGDTLIVPLLEEVLVVETKIRVREELRITRKRVEQHAPQTVRLRRETATVEREPATREPMKNS